MGKTSKWFRNFLAGKKDKDKEKQKCHSNQNPVFSTKNLNSPISQTIPKEKRRWSFRRSSAAASFSKDINSAEHHVTPPIVQVSLDAEINEQKRHAMAVVVATAAAADAAVAAAQAAAAVIRLTEA